MEQRPGHEARTDLYEKAKATSETEPHEFWFEHPGMPERPVGYHGTTRANSPMEALENVRSEVAGAEGTHRLQDGDHIIRLHQKIWGGAGTHVYSISHKVRNNRTVPNQQGFMIPTIHDAHNDRVIRETTNFIHPKK